MEKIANKRGVSVSYGGGGFRFAGLSHRGSLLCLPDGIWAWPVAAPAEISEETLSLIFARAADLDFFIVGSGSEPWRMPEPLRTRFRDEHVSVDTMTTGPAVRTYNVMLMEGRRVGVGLIAID
jgi:uncharacterized protein